MFEDRTSPSLSLNHKHATLRQKGTRRGRDRRHLLATDRLDNGFRVIVLTGQRLRSRVLAFRWRNSTRRWVCFVSLMFGRSSDPWQIHCSRVACKHPLSWGFPRASQANSTSVSSCRFISNLLLTISAIIAQRTSRDHAKRTARMTASIICQTFLAAPRYALS